MWHSPIPEVGTHEFHELIDDIGFLEAIGHGSGVVVAPTGVGDMASSDVNPPPIRGFICFDLVQTISVLVGL